VCVCVCVCNKIIGSITCRVFKVTEFKIAEQYNMYDLWNKVRQIMKLFTKPHSTQIK